MALQQTSIADIGIWLYRLPNKKIRTPLLKTRLVRVDHKSLLVRCDDETANALKTVTQNDSSSSRTVDVIIRRSGDDAGAKLLRTRIESAKREPDSENVLFSLRFSEMQPEESEFLDAIVKTCASAA